MDISDFKDAFLGEAQDILARIENALVDLDERPDDREKLQDAFRQFHTLKGNAGTMGLDKITQLAHTIEDLLDTSLHAKTPISRPVLQTILEALDVIRALLDDFRTGQDRGIDPAPIIARLKASASPAATAAAGPAATTAAAPAESAAAEPAARAAAPASSEPKASALSTVRVSLQKLDSIMNMVEELTIIKARLLAQAGALRSDALTEEIKVFDRLIKQLQAEALETRLISVTDIFQGYRRVVRDTARALGKDVNFVIEDNGISIDRVLLDKISEPLIHVLRNSVDHGLEDAQARVGRGKPPAGTVVLRARREQGYAVVEVADDGGGIDAAKVKKKALSLGVITQAEADAMTDEVARYLICHPNFSTRDQVTEISGRGVGMDVVQRVMDSVNGRLEIESRLGEGTRIALHLPLNLAILQALMIKAGGQTFAAPLSDVLEIISLDSVNPASIENEPVVQLRGEIIPIVNLADKFRLPPDKGHGYGVVVQTIRGKVALRVETLVGRQEIVVKNFEGYLKHINGINSATIMGDGRVVLILDVRGSN